MSHFELRAFIDGEPTADMIHDRDNTISRIAPDHGSWAGEKGRSELCKAIFESAYDSAMIKAWGEMGRLANILQWLVDLQNGCPLPKYQDDWDRTMRQAHAAIAKVTGESTTPKG